jgi:hypothetical protein
VPIRGGLLVQVRSPSAAATLLYAGILRFAAMGILAANPSIG